MSKTLEVDVLAKQVFIQGKPLQVLGNINFQINPEKCVSLLGPSGCGKSTLLRLILGLENSYKGSIKLGGKVIEKPGLDRGSVFQEPRLMPWLSVRANIEFALPSSHNAQSATKQIQKLIDLVGLTGFENAWPHQLSGGMAQRVALARALVNLPDLLVLDEPFGALDSYTRMIMQEELLRILLQQKTMTLLVTHDVDEAIFLSDSIVILSKRPASVVTIVPVELEKPRKRTDTEFTGLRSKILKKLHR